MDLVARVVGASTCSIAIKNVSVNSLSLTIRLQRLVRGVWVMGFAPDELCGRGDCRHQSNWVTVLVTAPQGKLQSLWLRTF